MQKFPETTHVVHNQSAARSDINEFTANPALVDAVRTFVPRAVTTTLSDIGAHVGTAAFQHAAEIVNTQTPQLHTHDRWGHRIDHVEFHPAYHDIMAASLSYGSHSFAWTNDHDGANAE